MIYLLWAAPTLMVIAALASGRANTTVSAVFGLIATVPVVLLSAPYALSFEQLGLSLSRGLWIGAVIAPYILGGLLFWQVAARAPGGAPDAGQPLAEPATDETPIARRRLVFFASLLIGPFAESATGFGVGMLGTVLLLRRFNFAPRHLLVFALLSQTVIPWGAWSSGTLLAAAYVRIPPEELALYSLGPVALLMLVWLPLFWRTANAAGVPASRWECAREAGWIAAAMALLAVTTRYIGPETALLAAYGPLIVLRYFLDFRPGRTEVQSAARKVAPYVVLIFALAAVRLAPELRESLTALAKVAPFDDLPAWSPFFHAGTWLIVGALVTALIRKQVRYLGHEAKSAWSTGQHAVLTVFLFSMMAEALTAAGISGAFAQATFSALGEYAVLITPPLSAAFGVLTNSGNPGNSLFLPAQVALAEQAGLSVAMVAAVQHVSGMAMGFFSPVRMSIAASLSGARGQERAAYITLLPYATIALMLLVGVAFWTMSAGASLAP